MIKEVTCRKSGQRVRANVSHKFLISPSFLSLSLSRTAYIKSRSLSGKKKKRDFRHVAASLRFSQFSKTDLIKYRILYIIGPFHRRPYSHSTMNYLKLTSDEALVNCLLVRRKIMDTLASHPYLLEIS